ncbi:response regulator [Paenibacillus apiarius]|uniref:Response regulator n=1 Tax=Paenibacillus apiarius TaxID=46240 RepID=A0ABT4DUX7_9BACL|nr:response regulator [Paenibacillus apiarius]MCY9516401.1 response regulator [Paenibacillus apiarius]MCY9521139.1 response regulator [Paenibacillus apiarius]MCY9551986.1 response regulator [Paenibacillus apiarius]MCY9560931.1 response regulator [Paenibacillus apiarius]MCY9684560.1 response regulator [Paenibacillus apiarius]
MKSILVDDERLALVHLKKLLSATDKIVVEGAYQDPQMALQDISVLMPDVVFMDIDMPEMSGIDLAEQVQSALPSAQIVFITAYDDYAVKAFELNAIDYVLKPVEAKRLNVTIERLAERAAVAAAGAADKPLIRIIRCFQNLNIDIGAAPHQHLRWRTAKAQELFAYLLYHRGKLVRKESLIELLWPDVDAKKGYTQLYTTIYQVRKALEPYKDQLKIVSCEHSYMLMIHQAGIDCVQWEQEVEGLAPVSAHSINKYRDLLQRYSGDYLADCDYRWAEGERQRLRSLWLHLVTQIADYLVAANDFPAALEVYHRQLNVYPHIESGYYMLMRLYAELGDRNAAEEMYGKLCDMTMTEFGMKPQAAYQTWYERWSAN